jgi:SnoaL-like domain
MSSTAEDLLATVEQSPRATAAHDRAGWVSLFTDDGCVEDPVGSGSHVGHVQLGRFYDTFIGPREITFHRDLDIVTGTSVIRDLTLEVLMGQGVRLLVPTFIRYDLRERENGWQIARLRAYWELAPMIGAFLRNGVKALPASLQLSGALLRNQGLPGTARYASGLTRPARRGKRLVEQALADGRLTDRLRQCRWSKVIGAGSTVAASITTPSGRGVLFADLGDRGRGITAVSIFGNGT